MRPLLAVRPGGMIEEAVVGIFNAGCCVESCRRGHAWRYLANRKLENQPVHSRNHSRPLAVACLRRQAMLT
jgi:hypothetical protein